MVDRNALSEPGNIALDEHSDKNTFTAWTNASTANGMHLWPQLNHPGKQSPNFINTQPVAPSAIPLEGSIGTNFRMPRALTEPEIFQIIEKFAISAQLVKEVGFTGIQIHGSHGYVVNQFRELFPVAVKLNSADFMKGGFTEEESMQTALQGNATDLFGLGRAQVIDPDFPNKLLSKQNHSINIPSRTTEIAF